MHYHNCTDKVWRGITLARRHWLRTRDSNYAAEWSLAKRGHFSAGFALFMHEYAGGEVLSVHCRLIWLWLSLSMASRTPWLRTVRNWFVRHFGPRKVSICYYDSAVTWELFYRPSHECRNVGPWWMKQYIRMPWHREWVSTEILSPDAQQVLWTETLRGQRELRAMRKRGNHEAADYLGALSQRAHSEAKHKATQTAEYRYVLKCGVEQFRIAQFYVERRAWGYLWLPLPINVRTSIWVDFDGGIGEGVHTWKGGTLGCGYDMKPGETALETLRRMESERTFDR